MRSLLLLAGLATGACDRVLGLEPRSAPDGPPPPADAPPDAHPTFGAVAPVTLECPVGRSPLGVTLDELERRFVYGCGAVESDIYEAQVVTPLTGGAPTAVVISPEDEGSPELSPGGISVYYLVPTMGFGRIDLKQRAAIEQPWGPPLDPDGLNTIADDRPGPPDATGTHFVITRGPPPGSVLVEVARDGDGAWREIPTTAAFQPVRSPINPQLSPDGRTLVFAATGQGYDLFVAQRAALGGPWAPATQIAEVNTSGDETDPWLSVDGRRLYFTRDGAVLLGRK